MSDGNKAILPVSIRVRGYHLDAYQHVNNARYLEFLEEARWHWLETSGDLAWYMQRGVGFVIANININYRKPALLNQHLSVDCHLERLGERSGVLQQRIVCVESGDLIADAAITFVCVYMKTQKVLALEGDLRERLEQGFARGCGATT